MSENSPRPGRGQIRGHEAGCGGSSRPGRGRHRGVCGSPRPGRGQTPADTCSWRVRSLNPGCDVATGVKAPSGPEASKPLAPPDHSPPALPSHLGWSPLGIAHLSSLCWWPDLPREAVCVAWGESASSRGSLKGWGWRGPRAPPSCPGGCSVGLGAVRPGRGGALGPSFGSLASRGSVSQGPRASAGRSGAQGWSPLCPLFGPSYSTVWLLRGEGDDDSNRSRASPLPPMGGALILLGWCWPWVRRSP